MSEVEPQRSREQKVNRQMGHPRERRSIFGRIVHRYNKARADHYIVRGTLQHEFYQYNGLHNALNSPEGRSLSDAIDELKAAKRAYSRREIGAFELTRARDNVKYAIQDLHELGDDYRTRISEWMQDFVIPQFANNVQSLVYAGAGALVMVVGLRGLGDLRSVGFMPEVLLDQDGMIHSWIVFAGLCLEFGMLILLAALFFFSADETRYSKSSNDENGHAEGTSPNISALKLEGLTQNALQALIERKVDEIRMIERIQKML